MFLNKFTVGCNCYYSNDQMLSIQTYEDALADGTYSLDDYQRVFADSPFFGAFIH